MNDVLTSEGEYMSAPVNWYYNHESRDSELREKERLLDSLEIERAYSDSLEQRLRKYERVERRDSH